MTVHLLNDTLIDQIAAGEVIERPANLVKELLENAIDAHATEITVSVEDGGRGQVRVSDNGIGMSPEDAALCIERHATSKIAVFDDLVRVSTLGFRGEALPSIGSISKMTITTRPKTDLEGTRVVVEGGDVRGVSPAGCPPGTTVEVGIDQLQSIVALHKRNLALADMDLSNVVYADIYLRDVADQGALTTELEKYFVGASPAATIIGVGADAEARVMIGLIAAQ